MQLPGGEQYKEVSSKTFLHVHVNLQVSFGHLDVLKCLGGSAKMVQLGDPGHNQDKRKQGVENNRKDHWHDLHRNIDN